MTPLQKLLEALGACEEACAWAGERTLAQAWAECERGDWMIWLATRQHWMDDRELRGFACDCAERVLPLFEKQHPDDTRPRVAIETARRYARGEATEEELAAAEAAAGAAWAAAGAAGAAGAAARAAARAAASAARAAAGAAAGCAERQWQADRLRALYTPAPLEGE
jgi:hypothetical protein